MADSTHTTGTAALSAEVKALYDKDFYMAGQSNVYFDQFANLKVQMGGQRGNTYNWPIIENLTPTTSPLDEYTDVVAQQMRANEIIITLQEFGGAVELTKFVVATSYSDPLQQAAYANAYQMAETFDLMARAVMGQGSMVMLPKGIAARSGIDGTEATHRISGAMLHRIATRARNSEMPLHQDGTVVIPIHPFVQYDLLQSTDIQNLGQWQHPEWLLNGEQAYYAGCRFVVTSNAKVFWGAGAAPTAAVDTTLAAAADIGATNLKLTAVDNVAVGDYINIIDAAEPGNVWSDTNECFVVTKVGTAGEEGTGVDGYALKAGPGDTGGLRFAHASGKAVTNNRAVFPLVVLGPNSIAKACSDFTGPYGETVVTPPIDTLQRFLKLGWYAIVGYTRVRNQWLHRAEIGTSEV